MQDRSGPFDDDRLAENSLRTTAHGVGLFATISTAVEQQGSATNEIARDIQQAATGTGVD
jgi:hypothetical protein